CTIVPVPNRSWTFLFSSRRRHTRSYGDWSSDVCSSDLYDVSVNDPALTDWSLPTLGRFAGADNVRTIDKVCGAEDFSFYQKEVQIGRASCRERVKISAGG